MAKEEKKNKKLLIYVLICLFLVFVIIISITLAQNGSKPNKDYISSDELSSQIEKDKENAIADNAVAYGEIYVSKHHDTCPNSLSDFLNKTDVLKDLKFVRYSDSKCSITYTNYEGKTIERYINN